MIARKQTSIKVDPIAWESAKKIFKEYGITASDAINMFLNQVRLYKGLPFEVKIPNDEILEAMKQVENGEYEEITLAQLKEDMKKCVIK